MPLPLPRSGLPSLVAVAAVCLALAPPALAGDPATSIEVNEVESQGLADFIELANTSGTATDVSGLVLKDDDDTRTLAIPGGTSIPAGGFLAVDTDVVGGFGMGSNDAARVFMPDGTTLIDGHSWTAHAVTTFGRCPDGTGAFATTTAVTKGAANACPAPVAMQPWPGGATVATVDPLNQHDGNVSGLDYEGSGTAVPGTLWVVDNGAPLLFRLLWNGTAWVNDTTNGWTSGKALRFPGGAGAPDSEGVTVTDDGSAGGVFVSSERDGSNNAVSRISILRYDVSGAATTLSATREWDLTADLPAMSPNAGAESVEWVPDDHLVASGLVDQSTGSAYDPADYPNHGSGLFFVGLEGNGNVYAYALDQNAGTFTRIAAFASGFPTFGALHFDTQEGRLWVVCDNNCAGRSRLFEIATTGAADGHFVAVADHARPAGMPDLNNEGFAMPSADECVDGSKPVFWADDGNTAGHALRAGTLDCTSPPTVGADFNGDGYADLAVGAPGEDLGDILQAGIVQVLYGGPSGLSGAGSQTFSQDRPGVPDAPEAGDRFGDAVAAGDFNGDGLTDLAIGVPGEGNAVEDDIGIVQILLGSAGGLTAAGTPSINQDTASVADATEPDDQFGTTLAAADVAGTAHDDLLIGVPFEDRGAADSGAVHILRGSASGPTGAGSALWTQDTGVVMDAAEPGDRFGFALATGDLGGTAAPELAIGAPGETLHGLAAAGVVHVLRGTASGPTDAGNQRFLQDTSGVPGASEATDDFGESLVMGDFNGDGRDDLAVGVPGEDLGAAGTAGAVLVLPGSPTGATATGSVQWTQASSGIAGEPGSGDAFGAALAAADLGSTAHDDLAIGVPNEPLSVGGAGAAHVLLGGPTGLSSTGAQFWHQDRPGIVNVAENDDRLGRALAAGTYRAGARAALAAGVPGESFGAETDAGGLNVIYGGDPGLVTPGNGFFSQDSAGIPDTTEPGDGFASALG